MIISERNIDLTYLKTDEGPRIARIKSQLRAKPRTSNWPALLAFKWGRCSIPDIVGNDADRKRHRVRSIFSNILGLLGWGMDFHA